jgi:hypothetical protein
MVLGVVFCGANIAIKNDDKRQKKHHLKSGV